MPDWLNGMCWDTTKETEQKLLRVLREVKWIPEENEGSSLSTCGGVACMTTWREIGTSTIRVLPVCLPGFHIELLQRIIGALLMQPETLPVPSDLQDWHTAQRSYSTVLSAQFRCQSFNKYCPTWGNVVCSQSLKHLPTTFKVKRATKKKNEDNKTTKQ